MKDSNGGQRLIANAPHNSGSGGKTREEEELEKAIAMSLADAGGAGGAGGAMEAVDANLDPELAQALLLSKQLSEGVVSAPPVVDLTAEGGDELQATLLASIQTAQGKSPVVTSDPTTMARNGSLPVGLKNVGNTCYLNSLIQTYFMIPVLRKAVISYRPVVPVDEKNPNHAFMLELQKLFCSMVLSNQRFVDPSNLLKKIVDDQGKPVSIGAQEDVSEFNDIFMTRLTNGLDLVHPPPETGKESDPSSQDSNPLAASSNSVPDATELTNQRLQRMFLPNVVEVVKAQEPDGEPIEQSHSIDFGRNFILPVNEETDLFTSLDQFMSDDVTDWETPKGNKVAAKRWKWLRHTPEVLFFQQQRAVWAGDAMKANHKLKFPEVLHMNRYDIRHAEFVTRIRALNAQRQAHLSELTKQIAPYLNFDEAGGAKLDSVLNGTIKYLEMLVQRDHASAKPGHSSEQVELMRRSVAMLRECQVQEAETLKRLQEEKRALETELDASFASINSEPYKLFAVWVHAGAAVGGHYWAYIHEASPSGTGQRGAETSSASPSSGVSSDHPDSMDQTVPHAVVDQSTGDDSWYKFNDTDTNRVQLAKVLEDGYGGQGVTSAYFLIYMKERLYERCKHIVDKAEGIPDALRAEVLASNADFEKKLQEYRENGVEGKIERFVTSYKNKVAQTIDYANKYTMERDMRYYSVFAYLLSLGLEEEMHAAVASEMWLRTFGAGIGKSQTTVQFEKLLTQPVPGTSVLFKAVSLNENEEDKKKYEMWKENHKAFRQVFMHTQQSLRFLTHELSVSSSSVAATTATTTGNNVATGPTERQEALRHLYVAYFKNEALSSDVARRRDLEDLLQLAIVLCLHECTSLVGSNLNQAVSVLEDMCHVICGLLPIIGENIKALVLDAIFSVLADTNPDFLGNARVEAIQEKLINAEPIAEKDRKWQKYPPPTMPQELDEWERLINQSRDHYETIKKKYQGVMTQHGLPQLRILMPSSLPSTSTTTQQQDIAQPSPPSTASQTETTHPATAAGEGTIPDSLPSTFGSDTSIPFNNVGNSNSNSNTAMSIDTPHMSSDLSKMLVDSNTATSHSSSTNSDEGHLHHQQHKTDVVGSSTATSSMMDVDKAPIASHHDAPHH